jgi:sulfotransferase
VGSAEYRYVVVYDAVTRGWLDCMHFVEYDDLTSDPQSTLNGVYEFLGEESWQHDFNNVQQVTIEDDFVYGFKDLHTIRPVVKPQAARWPHTFDDAVFQTPVWKNIENLSTFWRAYQTRPDASSSQSRTRLDRTPGSGTAKNPFSH